MPQMEPLRGRPASEVVARLLARWRELLTASDMRAGCAVVAVTVSGSDADLLDHAGRVFAAWRAQMASLLVDGGGVIAHSATSSGRTRS